MILSQMQNKFALRRKEVDNSRVFLVAFTEILLNSWNSKTGHGLPVASVSEDNWFQENLSSFQAPTSADRHAALSFQQVRSTSTHFFQMQMREAQFEYPEVKKVNTVE